MHEEQMRQQFLDIWKSVEERYRTGFCVSERGLQALLYAELSNKLDAANIVVEPNWTVDGKKHVPDIVMVEQDVINHIFELKFVPHHYAELKQDVRKLLSYGRMNNGQYFGKINPDTGQWEEELAIAKDCALHFVVVASDQSAAVWPNSIREEVPELTYNENRGRINLWHGRIGFTSMQSARWSIEFGI
jgi:hypothetical protein